MKCADFFKWAQQEQSKGSQTYKTWDLAHSCQATDRVGLGLWKATWESPRHQVLSKMPDLGPNLQNLLIWRGAAARQEQVLGPGDFPKVRARVSTAGPPRALV